MRYFVHNVIAHPLLALCPPLGEWLHERTIPDVEPGVITVEFTEAERRIAIDLLAKALEREDPIAHLSPYGTAVAVRLSACRELGLDPDEIPDP